jgi:hypothetical protein
VERPPVGHGTNIEVLKAFIFTFALKASSPVKWQSEFRFPSLVRDGQYPPTVVLARPQLNVGSGRDFHLILFGDTLLRFNPTVPCPGHVAGPLAIQNNIVNISLKSPV